MLDKVTTNECFFLIAEDDPDHYFLLHDAVDAAGLGVEVKWVDDGERLLTFLDECLERRHLPKVLLLDLNMPRKDGREALARLREDRRFANLPVVVLTTSTSEEDSQLAKSLGVQDFFHKPLRFHDYVELMGQVGRRFL